MYSHHSFARATDPMSTWDLWMVLNRYNLSHWTYFEVLGSQKNHYKSWMSCSNSFQTKHQHKVQNQPNKLSPHPEVSASGVWATDSAHRLRPPWVSLSALSSVAGPQACLFWVLRCCSWYSLESSQGRGPRMFFHSSKLVSFSFCRDEGIKKQKHETRFQLRKRSVDKTGSWREYDNIYSIFFTLLEYRTWCRS